MLDVTDQPVPLTADPNGVLQIQGTRVTLHSVVGMFEDGASPEEIAHEYDSLALSDVYSVLAWYLRNREEVDEELARLEERSEDAATRFARAVPDALLRKLRGDESGRGGG